MEKLELPGDVLMPHLHIWKVWERNHWKYFVDLTGVFRWSYLIISGKSIVNNNNLHFFKL